LLQRVLQALQLLHGLVLFSLALRQDALQSLGLFGFDRYGLHQSFTVRSKSFHLTRQKLEDVLFAFKAGRQHLNLFPMLFGLTSHVTQKILPSFPGLSDLPHHCFPLLNLL
jgi:hypothetical protein